MNGKRNSTFTNEGMLRLELLKDQINDTMEVVKR